MVSKYPSDLEGYERYMSRDNEIRVAEVRAAKALASEMGMTVLEVPGVYFVAVPEGAEVITSITMERMVEKLREKRDGS